MANNPLLGSFGDVSGGSLMFRNRIINGDMLIDQRKTNATANGNYSVDRWQFIKINDASETVARASDAPTGTGLLYSLRNTVGTGDPVIASTQYSGLITVIEGYNVADLAFGTSLAKDVTVGFWIRSSVTGVYTGNLSNSDASRICPFNFTINAANTWEFKTVNLPGCPDGVWDKVNGGGLTFRVYAAIGSSYLGGTSGIWNSALQYGSGSPVNGIASNGNIFAITGVQVEAGPYLTPYQFLPFQTQLALCQRYYEKSYNYDVQPGTNTSVGRVVLTGSSDSGSNLYIPISFKVTKRTASMSFGFWRQDGTPNTWEAVRSGTTSFPTPQANNPGDNGFSISANIGAAWVVGAIYGHWVASAEL
jgi:hypothetical protein